MATCPNCQCETPSGAVSCSRCGHPCDAADGAAPPTVRSVPLPPPMVEPIYTPAAPPPDSKPLPIQPALTRSLRGGGSSVVVVAEPVRTPPATVFGYSALPNGASPPTLRDRPGPGTATAGSVPGVSVAVPTPAPTPPDVSPSAPPVRLRLVVLRGLRVAAEYPIYEGRNTIGRFVDKPVDIDLISQEPIEQVWCSRLHAAITFDRGVALVEDLNSLNGTWVNGARIHPGQLRPLKVNDVIQIGTVQMKLVVG